MNEMIMIVLGIALLLGLILLSFTKTLKPRAKSLDKQLVQQRWQRIQQTAANPGHAANSAVVEADKLLDYVLKARGYQGETMGERLKAAGRDFSYTDDVWSAHKLRNKLVHEAEYEPDKRLITRAVKQSQQALKDLGAL